MIIVVEGTKNFSDYETFMRAMGVAFSEIKNEESIEVWSVGPHNINNFTAAFCNSVENYFPFYSALCFKYSYFYTREFC